MNIIICDDETGICDSLSQTLKKHYQDRPDFGIVCFNDCDCLKAAINEGKTPVPDMLIMDIIIGEKNGCFEAGELQRLLPEARIIFLTGYPKYAEDIFACVSPSNILLKPVDGKRLIKAVDKAYMESLQERDDSRYEIKLKNTVKILKYRDIIYVESSGRKLKLHTSEEDIVFYHKISEFIEETGGFFVQCHQSYAVNPRRIKALYTSEVIMDDGSEAGVSRARYKLLRDILLDFPE